MKNKPKKEKNKNPRPSCIGFWIKRKLGVEKSLEFDPDSLACQLGFPFDQGGKVYDPV